MTDKPMTNKPMIFSTPMVQALLDGRKTQGRRILKLPKGCYPENPETDRHRMPVKFKIGDRIWVKETHWVYGRWVVSGGLTKSGKPKRRFDRLRERGVDNVSFSAPEYPMKNSYDRMNGWYKRLDRFMFKADSRLTLTIANVRVQRLQDITEADAIAEGVDPAYPHSGFYVEQFSRLMNSLHGPDIWDKNPWVAAYTFTVQQQNIDAIKENR